MPGFNMVDFVSPTLILKKVGMSVSDITDVIITHSHHDHIEAVKYFTNAIIHMTKAEYECGKGYIPDGFLVNTSENEYTMNSYIKIIEWAGHTSGSAIVELSIGDIIHVFAGDECYTKANIDRKICTGSFGNKEKAVDFVEKYSKPKYVVHTCHDISLKTERISCSWIKE